MKQILKNKRGKEVLQKMLAGERDERMTVSFYRYFEIENPQKYRDELFLLWSACRVLGRVYVSQEGINAQINIPKPNWVGFQKIVAQTKGLEHMRYKIGVAEDGESFLRLTIKLREKIVADGLAEKEIDLQKIGEHVSAHEINRAVKDKNALVVDMRNHYEYEVGHFDGAVCPNTATFKQALPEAVKIAKAYKEKEVVLYCTGGIRCEKASAYFIRQGFKNVKQLHGGIIAYAHQTKAEKLENTYKGKNFVFDGRNSEPIGTEIISNCHQCGAACDQHTNCKNAICHLMFIQCDTCKKTFDNCCSDACQDVKNKKFEKKYAKSEDTLRIYSKHAKKNLTIPQSA